MRRFRLQPGLLVQGTWWSLGDEQGSTLVEFAIVLVLLLTFLFGIMDFSRFLYTYHFVSDAAREGTRYAIVRGSSFATSECTSSAPYHCYVKAADVTTYVQGITPLGITSSSVTVTTTWPKTTPDSTDCGSAANSTTGLYDMPGCPVKVVVTYPFKFMFPFLPSRASTWTVSSTSQMIISQ